MKRSILRTTITLLIINTFFFTPAKGETITVGYFLLEPHSKQQNEKHIGAIIDFWRLHIAPKMKVKINFVGPYPVPRLIRETTSGRVNVIALLAKNDERSKILDYPDMPFTNTSSAIAFLREHKIHQIDRITSLNGLTLGFFGMGFIHPLLKNQKIDWSITYRTDWLKVNLKILSFKRIDGIYHPDRHSLRHGIRVNKMENSVKILKIPETQIGLYSLFSKNDKGVYLKRYNKILPYVLKNISYEKMMKKYMKNLNIQTHNYLQNESF
jgi:hypothetical protein